MGAVVALLETQPLVEADGPHEEILDRLLADRQRIMEQGSARIASVNDRTILAVAEVVRLCAESRAAQPETVNG